MPEKYSPYRVGYKDDLLVSQVSIETYDCPRCGFRIPVREEHLDYRRLYERELQYHKRTVEAFDKTILELQEHIPEVKVYMRWKWQDLRQLLLDLKNKFRGDRLPE